MNYELLKAISPGKDFCIKDIFPQKYTHTKKHPVIHTSYFILPSSFTPSLAPPR